MLIVIPARGGSKRVPRKNIQPLAGVPLLAYTLAAAVAAELSAPPLVSTEDAEIAAVATAWGAAVIERPAALAADTASTEAVLLHALEQAERQRAITWVMTLPPTSPFRSAATIRRFAALATQDDISADCIMSVTENRGDFWRMSSDGRLHRLFPNAPRRQQDREPLYEENSAVYLTRAAALRETGSILGRGVAGLAIPPREAFDINTADDLRLAEAVVASDPSLIPTRHPTRNR